MLLYTSPTPCTFAGSTTDAQSYCTCPCSISWGLAAKLPNCTNSPAQNCPATPHVHHSRVSGCSLFSFLKPLPLEPCALNVTPFCPYAEIPSSSTGSSSHAAAVGPTARVFALHFEASKSRHCPREAAVFGFYEEPARGVALLRLQDVLLQ